MACPKIDEKIEVEENYQDTQTTIEVTGDCKLRLIYRDLISGTQG